jgi:Effector Associated Constant Component 1
MTGRPRTMGAAPIQLVVRVDAGPDADDEELAGLALRLRDDLQQLDEASVELAREGTTPPGAKSGDPVEWGTLIVSAVTSGALSAVLKTAQAWLARRRGSSLSVKIGDDELVLTGASTDEQRRVIEDWLARREAAEAANG